MADQPDRSETDGSITSPPNIGSLRAEAISRAGAIRGRTLDRDELNIPIHLSELTTIASTNSKSSFWWSVATLSFGTGLAFYLAGLTIATPNAKQIALTQYLPIACGIFMIFSLIAAWREMAHWKSEVSKIQRECGLNASTWPVRFRNWWKGDV
jgi:hypothetical protein